ncbi:MAG TPA: ribbon-helix-helix protein, CopG family [Acidimicrobiales bacterium]|nr:ribbon-helix-helix protein, CopG family [Acidimicrobiales bacterium]
MSMNRTQIYLTDELRARIDARARAEGTTMAEVVRHAVERYVDEPVDVDGTLDATFGSVAKVVVPSRDDWDRG